MHRYKEGDIIGDNLLVIHNPGHTPGSIALYDSKNKVIFVGDTLRFIKGKVEGPPMQFTRDFDSVKKSIQKISKLDFEAMFSGHGQPLLSTKAPDMIKEVIEKL